MAEIPLNIKVNADTAEATAALEDVSESVDELSASNEQAAETTEQLNESTEELADSAEAAAAAQRTMASSVQATATASTAAAASIQQAGQGLSALNRFAGQAGMAISLFSAKTEAMRAYTERATEALREQARAMGRIAWMGIQLGQQGHLTSLGTGYDTTFKDDLSDPNRVNMRALGGPTGGLTAGGGGRRRGGGGGRGRGGGEAPADMTFTVAEAETFEVRGMTTDEAAAADREAAYYEDRQDRLQTHNDRMLEINRTYLDTLDEINQDGIDRRKREAEAQQQIREKTVNDVMTGIGMFGKVSDMAMGALGASEADRLALRGLVAGLEGGALLIGSFGTNPEGYAKLAEAAAFVAASVQVASESGGGGGGGHSGGGGRGGGGGSYGAGMAAGYGMGANSVPETVVINNYGLVRERDAGDVIAGYLERRGRRGYPLKKSATERR